MATKIKKVNKTTDKNKHKFRMKMPYVFSLLFGIVLLIMVISWFAPSGYYLQDSYFSAGTKNIGIINSFYSIAQGFMDAANLIFFLFGIGAFITLTMKSQALQATIGLGLKKLKGKEIWMIPSFLLFFAFGGTTYGMSEETIGFYLLIVPIFILAGFDAMTGVFVILLGSGVGVLASTVNPFSIGVAVDTANISENITSMGEGMGFRWIAFVVFYLVALAWIMYYAKRVKKDKSNSAMSAEDMKMHDDWAKQNINVDKILKLDVRKKITVTIFFFTLFWMVFVLIPWSEFGADAFSWLSNWMATDVSWLDNGTSGTEIGTWYFLQLGVLFLIIAIVIGLVNKNKLPQIYEYCLDGAKDMMFVAMVIVVARAVTMVLGGSTQLIGIEEVKGVANNYIVVGVNGNELATTADGGATWSAAKDVTVTKHTLDWLAANTAQVGGGDELLFILDKVSKDEINTYSTVYDVNVNLSSSLLNSLSGISSMPDYLYNPTVFILYLPLSFLIPSTSGLASATMEIMGPLGYEITGSATSTITAFSFASGVINLFTPTSGVVMGALAISKVNYGVFMKAVWKFLVITVIVSIILMVLSTWMTF